jgi:hypothetical protein
MRFLVLAVLLLPSLALAQPISQQPPSATFAGQLATALSQEVDRSAALQKQVEALQKQIEDAKAPKGEEPKP